MKEFRLFIDESIFEEVLSHLQSFPQDKIRILESSITNLTDVEAVDEEEQNEIEALLNDEDTKIFELRRFLSI